MSSVDHDTATVHATKREKMTARTASSRTEVLILKFVAFVGIFKSHVLTLTLGAQKFLKIAAMRWISRLSLKHETDKYVIEK